MSDNKSWKENSTNFTEAAIELVRDCVATMRATGARPAASGSRAIAETKNALPAIADALGLSQRRAKCLFYRDGFPVVLKNEWMNLRFKAGLFFLNNAVKLRDLADECEARGEDLVSGQQEFTWAEHTNVSQKRCA